VTPEGVMTVGQEAIKTILLVAGPMLGLSLVVGLMVSAFQAMTHSAFQAMTQINEMTLTFLPKIITMFIVLLVMFPWMLQILLGFMTGVWGQIPEMSR
jgi:flagellar biosynthetic protein FliQ